MSLSPPDLKTAESEQRLAEVELQEFITKSCLKALYRISGWAIWHKHHSTIHLPNRQHILFCCDVAAKVLFVYYAKLL